MILFHTVTDGEFLPLYNPVAGDRESVKRGSDVKPVYPGLKVLQERLNAAAAMMRKFGRSDKNEGMMTRGSHFLAR
jgi:hypothetical protein